MGGLLGLLQASVTGRGLPRAPLLALQLPVHLGRGDQPCPAKSLLEVN